MESAADFLQSVLDGTVNLRDSKKPPTLAEMVAWDGRLPATSRRAAMMAPTIKAMTGSKPRGQRRAILADADATILNHTIKPPKVKLAAGVIDDFVANADRQNAPAAPTSDALAHYYTVRIVAESYGQHGPAF
jgi:hypothetical protein